MIHKSKKKKNKTFNKIMYKWNTIKYFFFLLRISFIIKSYDYINYIIDDINGRIFSSPNQKISNKASKRFHSILIVVPIFFFFFFFYYISRLKYIPSFQYPIIHIKYLCIIIHMLVFLMVELDNQ